MKKCPFSSTVYCCPSRTIPQGVVNSCSPCSFVTLATHVEQHKGRSEELGSLRLTCEELVRSLFPLHVVSVWLVVTLWPCLGLCWADRNFQQSQLCLTFGSSAQSAKPPGEKKAQAFRSRVTQLPEPISLGKRERREMKSPGIQTTVLVRELPVPQRMSSNQVFQAEWETQVPPPHCAPGGWVFSALKEIPECPV